MAESEEQLIADIEAYLRHVAIESVQGAIGRLMAAINKAAKQALDNISKED